MDAIDRDDPAQLREELGDLLFHVVIHAQLASETGAFDLAAIARSAGEKLVRRHPHVFAGTDLRGGDVLEQWERIKREERAGKGTPEASIFDGVPASLPALYTAERLVERAARIGITPDRVDLPLDVDDADALGDLLFDIAALAREQGLDAEGALRAATMRFRERMRRVEDRARGEGRDLAAYSPAELRALWEASA